MARDGATYACQSCGAAHGKWAGQCPACGAWNTLVEESLARPPGALAPARGAKTRGLAFEGLESLSPPPPRIATGVAEFDRVCGGGVVPGSAILLAGDPGVGKSTLLLQVCAEAARRGAACAYISGEEAVEQIRARAHRMGLADAAVKLAAETSLRDIVEGLKREAWDLVVIDSIQTLWSECSRRAGVGHPGSRLRRRAGAPGQEGGVAVVLVGHVTKDGQPPGLVWSAGCRRRALLEGERGYPFRIPRGQELAAHRRSASSRWATAALPRSAPSALFLNEGGERAAGAAVFAGIEGSRPVLVEFQALVAPSVYGTPRRAVVGWDSGRLAMVMAVLEARCGFDLPRDARI